MTNAVEVAREGRVLTITFNRPEKKNALTHEMYAATADALEAAQADRNVRCVMVTGAGETFTAGNDLEDFARGMPPGKPPVQRFLEAIRDAEKPLMAAVNGPAVGVGLTMLLHCDLAYAGESATFRAPFPHLGLVPEAGSSLLLPLSLGNAYANDVFLAGRVLSASEALSAGLVSRVFADDALKAEALKIATVVAAQAPEAMRKSKALIRSNRALVTERMMTEGALFAEQLQSPEFMISAAAYMARRLPSFD